MPKPKKEEKCFMFCYDTFLWFYVFWYNFHNLFRHKSGGRKKGTFLLILNYKSIGFSSGSGFLRIDRFYSERWNWVKSGGKLGLGHGSHESKFLTQKPRKFLATLNLPVGCSSLQTNHFPAYSKTPCLFYTYLSSATSNNNWNLFLFVFHFRSK